MTKSVALGRLGVSCELRSARTAFLSCVSMQALFYVDLY